MGFIELIKKETISSEFYVEVTDIFATLTKDDCLILNNMLFNTDITSPAVLFLIGAYYESINSNDMFQYYYLAIAQSYLPAFCRLSIIAYSKSQFIEGDNYLLAAIAKNDKKAMILLANKYKLIDHNYKLAEKYLLLAKDYNRLADLYCHYYNNIEEAKYFYLEGILENNEDCYYNFINYYIELINNENKLYYSAKWQERKNAYLLIANHLEKTNDYRHSIRFYNLCYNIKNPYELNLLHEKYKKFSLDNEFYMYVATLIS